MAVKSDRMEVRVAPSDRARIEQAASAAGVTVSSFIVDTAVERAESIIAASTTSTLTADYFDTLLAALDHADHAPGLTAAAKRAKRHPRVTHA